MLANYISNKQALLVKVKGLWDNREQLSPTVVTACGGGGWAPACMNRSYKLPGLFYVCDKALF